MAAKGNRRSSFSLTVSNQYGAWSILLACYFAGALVGGGTDPRMFILLPAVILGFMARHGAGVYLRSTRAEYRREVLGWTEAYSFLVLVVWGVLVVYYALWMLVPLGAVVLVFAVATVALSQRRMETTAAGELIGILGLTLVAPIAEYVSVGSFTSETVAVWLLCAFFFCGSVFHVRYLVRRRADTVGPLATRIRSGSMSIAYHTAVLTVAFVLAFAGILPLFSPVALIPASTRAWAAVGRRLRKALPVRAIGVAEVLNTVFFLVLLGLSFHIS